MKIKIFAQILLHIKAGLLTKNRSNPPSKHEIRQIQVGRKKKKKESRFIVFFNSFFFIINIILIIISI